MAQKQAKTKLVNGERIDIATGNPYSETPASSGLVISSSGLANSPDFKYTPARPDSQSEALGGIASLAKDDYQAFLDKAAAQREADKERSKNQYLSELLNQPTETEMTADLYSTEGGVDDIQKELDAINQSLREEEIARVRAVERIDKNEEGLLASAVADEKARISKESYQKQADMYIIQQGIQGRYDSAKAVADRAVQARFERQRNINEALRINFEDNRELFSKAEQRAFESAQSTRERALDAEERRAQEVSNLSIEALKEGAPSSVVAAMRAAKTPEEAIAIGGGYIGSTARAQKGLAQRTALFDLAMKGDKYAIGQLGYDPRTGTEEYIEAQRKKELAYENAKKNSEAISSAIENVRGLKASISNTGIFGRTLNYLGDAKTSNATLAQVIRGEVEPKQEGILSAVNNFRTDAEFVISNLTLDKLSKLEVPLTPVSEADLVIVGQSASELAGLADFNSKGELVGFTGTEDKVLEIFGEIMYRYNRVMDEVNATQGLSADELEFLSQ